MAKTHTNYYIPHTKHATHNNNYLTNCGAGLASAPQLCYTEEIRRMI